jgi:hypothetical protein
MPSFMRATIASIAACTPAVTGGPSMKRYRPSSKAGGGAIRGTLVALRSEV